MRNKGANRKAMRRKRAPRRPEPPGNVSVATTKGRPLVAYLYFGHPVRFLPTLAEWTNRKQKGNWAFEEEDV